MIVGNWGEGGAWRLRIALALVLLTGCAQETTPLLREDLERLRADLLKSERALQKSQADLRVEVQQADLHSAQALAEVQKSLTRLGTRVDQLSRDTTQVQGRLEELRRRVDILALQLDVAGTPTGPLPVAQAAAVPARPSGNVGPGAGAPSSTPSATQPRVPGPTTTPANSDASNLYQTAYIDYTRGNYNLSIAAFREFLRRYPKTDLAEKAQYWIGECYFSLARQLQARGEGERATQELERARKEFEQVFIQYPRGDRVSAALYKEALALAELNQVGPAEARLRLLMEQYPTSEEAAKAKDDLVRLRKR